MPDHYAAFINAHPALNDSVRIGIFGAKGWVKDYFIPITVPQMANLRQNQESVATTIRPDLPKGKYYMRFAINCGPRYATHNSDKIGLVIR